MHPRIIVSLGNYATRTIVTKYLQSHKTMGVAGLKDIKALTEHNGETSAADGAD